MATAKDKVFSTPELLEAILLEVNDMQTLLLSQRVDHTFKAAIDGSIRLQRALWFKPMPPDPLHSDGWFQRNPLIVKFRKRLGIADIAPGSAKPLSNKESGKYRSVGEKVRMKCLWLMGIRRRGGSWRKMIVCRSAQCNTTWFIFPGFKRGCLRLHCGWQSDGLSDWGLSFPLGQGQRSQRTWSILGPVISMGERTQTPTLGELVDEADVVATMCKQEYVEKHQTDENRAAFEEDLKKIERWWIKNGEEDIDAYYWTPWTIDEGPYFWKYDEQGKLRDSSQLGR